MSGEGAGAFRERGPVGPTSRRSRRPALGADDDAVSPVVGMILVLAISVTGIIAILTWGMPAISELKASVEFQAVSNQFTELNSDLDELIRGSSGKTAKRWKPSFDQGSMLLVEGSERWVVGVDLDDDLGDSNDRNFTVSGLFDTDNAFTLYNNDSTTYTLKVAAWTLDGGSKTPVNVSNDPACSDPTQMTPESLAGGGSVDLCLFKTTGAALNVDDVTLKIAVTDSNGNDLAKFYLTDVGAIKYSMTLGTSQREAFHSNGALLEGLPGRLYVATSPPFGPPRVSGDDNRFFARLVTFNGEASVGGPGRFDVLMSLYATSAISDDSDAVALKVWVDGVTHDAWFEYFLNDNPDHEFDKVAPNNGAEYIEYRPMDGMNQEGFNFKLVHSTVTVQG